jgi:lipoprotein-anchoring transpeptidase ErfK/SrfK
MAKKSSESVTPHKESQTQSDDVIEPGQKGSLRKHGWLAVGILSLVGLLGIVVCALGLYSMTHASIAGIAVNGVPKEELQKQLEAKISGYMLTVQYPTGETKTYGLPQVGISIDAAASVKEAMNARQPSSLLKHWQWWRPNNVPLVLSTNGKKLQNFVRTKATKIITPAKNATIKVKDGKVVLGHEKTGVAYAMQDTEETLLAAVSRLDTSALQTKQQAIEPNINEATVAPVAQKIRTMLAQNVTFKIESKSFKASPSDIGKWIDITPIETQKTIDTDVNSGKVLEYINRIAGPYVQPPKSRVVLETKSGGTKVLDTGQSGLDITNKNTLARQVANNLQKGQGSTVSAAIKYATYKTIKAQSYPKWIVVDVTTKRMYAYEYSRLVRTFLISSGAPATPTPLGTFHIYSKIRRQDMRGDNVDGTRYFQPNVEWVNYFYQANAIHGNYWRPLSYFGNVNSSHGCVGIVNTDAAWIYNWAPIGTTVITHD